MKKTLKRELLAQMERVVPWADLVDQILAVVNEVLTQRGLVHKFDVRCKALNIAHRLCLLRHPQTNGMVERFNGRISEVVKQTRFASAAQLEATLANCVKTYNHLIPQRALNHVSPVQALKNWLAKKSELFVKRDYNQL